MNTKVKVDLTKETDAEALKKTIAGLAGMTGNAHYGDSPITIEQWKTDKDDFSAKLAKAFRGSSADKLAKTTAREILDSDYRAIGNYINSVSGGDKIIAESSKFQLCKEKETENPPDLEARNLSTSGSIVVISRAKPKGLIARLIQYSYTPDDASSYVLVSVTKKQRKELANLAVGKRIWIRVAVVVDEDSIQFSPAFSIIIT